MRIELVGGLGIGKSTLCKTLERVGFNCIYENLKTNPFLADCFVRPEDFRFPSQMWFVLSKFHEIKKYEKIDRINVLDQAVLNVRAYTNMLFRNEDEDALKIIDQCFDYMEGQTGQPDLLINLQCSPEEQMRRIRGRNRDHERSVTMEYLESLQKEVNILIDKSREDGYAILDIDTEAVYLPGNTEYAENLAVRLADMFHVDITGLLSPCTEKETREIPFDSAPPMQQKQLAEAV